MSSRKAYLQMHFAIFLWGFTGILGKAIMLSEGVIVWYRLLLTCISLFIFFGLSKKLIPLQGKELIRIAGVGVLVTIHWILFYAAIKVSNVSITLSCLATTALWTALLEPLIYRNKKLNPTELLFSLFVIIGIYLIFHFQQLYTWGIIIALGSAVIGAVFTIFNKNLLNNYSTETVVIYELVAGFLFMSLLMPFYLQLFPGSDLIPTSVDWIYLLILSVVCTALAFTISLHALKEVSAFTMNLSVNLEPVYSIVLAILIFNENEVLNLGFYGGTAIILISVFAHSLLSYRKLRAERYLSI
jgi:drug/metabolite transporter (DMT)-like permease